MAVGVEAREGLQYRRSHLENERDDAYLRKREAELVLDDRVDGRYDRLNHVVQEVRNAANHEYRIHRTFSHSGVALDLVAY